jgi:hypothetical protein
MTPLEACAHRNDPRVGHRRVRAMKSADERATFAVELRAERHVADAHRTLRRALKILLRRCGLRCVSIREIADSEKAGR